MRQLLNKPWFVAALALSAIALVGSKFTDLSSFASRPVASTAAPGEEPASDEAAPDASTDTSLIAALEALLQPGAARDPFAALAVPAPAPEFAAVEAVPVAEAYQLSATWIQGGAAYALLNNRIVHPGETAGLVTLDTITREGAWLRHAQGREFVPVGHHLLVTPPPRPVVTPPRLASARES